MEQPIARNKSRLLPEDFLEGFQAIRSSRWKWLVCFVAAAMIVASLLLYYYQGLLESHSFWPLFGIAAGALILLGDFVFYPRIAGRMWFTKAQERFGQRKGEELLLSFSVWQDRIELSAKHAKTVSCYFRDLKGVAQTGDLLVFLFSGNLPVVMLSDSFLEGNAALVLDTVEKG